MSESLRQFTLEFSFTLPEDHSVPTVLTLSASIMAWTDQEAWNLLKSWLKIDSLRRLFPQAGRYQKTVLYFPQDGRDLPDMVGERLR